MGCAEAIPRLFIIKIFSVIADWDIFSSTRVKDFIAEDLLFELFRASLHQIGIKHLMVAQGHGDRLIEHD